MTPAKSKHLILLALCAVLCRSQGNIVKSRFNEIRDIVEDQRGSLPRFVQGLGSDKVVNASRACRQLL